MKWFNYSM